MTRTDLSMSAQDFGFALVVRFVTCISFAPAAFAGDALVPAVFLRLDISVSAGWEAEALRGDGMITSFSVCP
jgi:hypothetical protein